jgi:hypothetical protein
VVVPKRVFEELHVALMDEHWDAALAHPPGEADMVEVGVSQHYGRDGGQRPAEKPQQPVEGAPSARKPSIHNSQFVAVLDHVPVHVGMVDAVDTWNNAALDDSPHAAMPAIGLASLGRARQET